MGDGGDEGMPAVADLALGIAPIAGGMAIGAAAGYLKGRMSAARSSRILNC
jgi:hypothetical protein